MEVALIISTLLALGALIAWSRAKTPFESYFEARNTTDPDTQRKLLDRHASALMGHARELKRRDYSHWVEGSPDFVVMFIGADGILDAALDTRPALWEEAWQQHKELFLIRNLTRGRGVSFFDDFGYYPDFIVWLKDDDRQHVLFLDPKGLSRFGRRERKKVQLHHEIVEIEKQVRENDPDLYLRAYILSVTPASEIDDGGRRPSDWKKDGVYFLDDPDCLKQVITHALGGDAAP